MFDDGDVVDDGEGDGHDVDGDDDDEGIGGTRFRLPDLTDRSGGG